MESGGFGDGGRFCFNKKVNLSVSGNFQWMLLMILRICVVEVHMLCWTHPVDTVGVADSRDCFGLRVGRRDQNRAERR